MTTTTSPFHDPSPVSRGNADDPVYRELLDGFSRRFDELVASGVPLFTTDAPDLWRVYLETFPPADRQFHTCNACRRFIEHFGSLVVLENGKARSAVWDTDWLPDSYEVPELVTDAMTLGNTSILLDASGGRGVEATSWARPTSTVKLGYAGGITPENVAGVLEKLGNGAPCWIDMESGVRTDDVFDVAKVRSVLEQVKAWNERMRPCSS